MGEECQGLNSSQELNAQEAEAVYVTGATTEIDVAPQEVRVVEEQDSL